MARTLKIKAGSNIVPDDPSEVCLVLSGKVKAPSSGGQQLLQPGEVIAEGSQAYAVEDAEVLFVSLLELQRVKPEMAGMLIKELERRELERRDLDRRELEARALQDRPEAGRQKPPPEADRLKPPGVMTVAEGASEHGQEKKPRYLYESEVKCPVCDQAFIAVKIFETKLQQTSMDSDLRRHFQDFEPLHYRVWVCPNCLYANFSNKYSSLKPAEKKALLEAAGDRKNLLATLPDPGGETGRAVRDHRLLLENLGCIKESFDTLGRAWLDLAWLYEDLGDAEEALASRKKALEGYEQFYLNSYSLSPTVEIQVLYLIGELSKRLGDLKKAYGYFMKAIHFPDNSSVMLKEMARDGLQELRELSKHTPPSDPAVGAPG